MKVLAPAVLFASSISPVPDAMLAVSGTVVPRGGRKDNLQRYTDGCGVALGCQVSHFPAHPLGLGEVPREGRCSV